MTTSVRALLGDRDEVERDGVVDATDRHDLRQIDGDALALERLAPPLADRDFDLAGAMLQNRDTLLRQPDANRPLPRLECEHLDCDRQRLWSAARLNRRFAFVDNGLAIGRVLRGRRLLRGGRCSEEHYGESAPHTRDEAVHGVHFGAIRNSRPPDVATYTLPLASTGSLRVMMPAPRFIARSTAGFGTIWKPASVQATPSRCDHVQ